MNSISFDNVYLLFLIIPFVAIIVVPYVIAVRKENANGHNIASLVIHLVISLFVCFAIAGTTITAVITETEVYVVADVSYSANRNLDTVDSYVRNVNGNLPANSRMGVVAFGKDYELITPLGDRFTTVRDAHVDDTPINTAQALTYASGLFSEGVIKRIVLITDGNDSSPDASSGLMGTINTLYENNIYVDAIYVDNNLPDDTDEVQVTSADFNENSFMNRPSRADITIHSGSERNVMLTFSVREEGGEERVISRSAPTLSMGINVFNFDLDTSAAGTFTYTVSVEPERGDDLNDFNDSLSFTQTVYDKMNVCLIFPRADQGFGDDRDAILDLYGEDAEVTVFNVARQGIEPVPSIVEELCRYDQIVLTNTDVTSFDNYTSFTEALEIVVSYYGKTLITLGDTGIQTQLNQEDEEFEEKTEARAAMQDLLPVSFGNDSLERQHFIFVIDNSLSMLNNGHLDKAKQTVRLICDNYVSEDSAVTLVAFWGDVMSYSWSTFNQTAYNDLFDNRFPTLTGRQGTSIYVGLSTALNSLSYYPDFARTSVFLLSDGAARATGETSEEALASQIYNNGGYVSCFFYGTSENAADAALMSRIAFAGCGYDKEASNYYAIEGDASIPDIIFSEMGDSQTQSVITGDISVNIELENDEVVEGVASLPNVSGIYYGRAKSSATTVLTANVVDAETEETEQIPLYSYWAYGNGRVATLASAVGTGWMSNWLQGDGLSVLRGILFSNTPSVRVDTPFMFSASNTEGYVAFELTPSYLSGTATATLDITLPDGTQQSLNMAFASDRYTYNYVPEQVGRHVVTVTYAVGDAEYTTQTYVDVAFLGEHNAFGYYTAATLNTLLAGRGQVSEDGTLVLVNPEDELSTFTLSLTVPLLIASVVLFVIDIIIRKLKWNDIKSLFVKIK